MEIISIVLSVIAVVVSVVALILLLINKRTLQADNKVKTYIYVKLGVHHIRNELTANEELVVYDANDLIIENGDLLIVPTAKEIYEIGTAMTTFFSNSADLKSPNPKKVRYNITKKEGKPIKIGNSNLELVGFKNQNIKIFKFINTLDKVEEYIDLKELYEGVDILQFTYMNTKPNTFIVNASGIDTTCGDTVMLEFIITYHDYLDTIIIWGDMINHAKKLRSEFDKRLFYISEKKSIKNNLKIVK